MESKAVVPSGGVSCPTNHVRIRDPYRHDPQKAPKPITLTGSDPDAPP